MGVLRADTRPIAVAEPSSASDALAPRREADDVLAGGGAGGGAGAPLGGDAGGDDAGGEAEGDDAGGGEGGDGELPAARPVLQRLSASNAPRQARATGMRGRRFVPASHLECALYL